MIHNTINEKGDHWAANHNGYGEILVQLQENAEQVRVKMSIEDATYMANRLLEVIEIAKTQESLEVALERYKQSKDAA